MKLQHNHRIEPDRRQRRFAPPAPKPFVIEGSGHKVGWVMAAQIGTVSAFSLIVIFARLVNVARSKGLTFSPRTLLLVNVPPGVTSAEKLSELLVQERFPDPIPFAGAYVCGRFPITTSSCGGYRVLPIRDLPANPTFENGRAKERRAAQRGR